MGDVPADFYTRWRTQNEARLSLRERGGSGPSERLLQSVWHHQRLRRDQLKTIDGRPVQILHPGFWNHAAGPDFHGSVVQIGQEEARSGDIEIDLTRQNWQSHQHHRNPAFENVVLHVVWTAAAAEGAPGEMPVLALETFLDLPIEEMQTWLETPAANSWPETLRGACSAPLSQLSRDQSNGLLRQAALVRFQRKGAELEIRARQAGWEHALWEGLFRALGYKQNVWPMQRLAELLPRLGEGESGVIDWQARLLGVSGFLGATHEQSGDHAYLKTLWNLWWREREKFQDAVLPKSLWRMNGLRPANQPQRRLALAAHWLAAKNLLPRLEDWFLNSPRDGNQPGLLLDSLQPAQDDFWSQHWSFYSPRLAKPQPLLGESRATDAAINVILPWFWVRARAGRNEQLTQLAEQRFLNWPAAQDNSLLRLARQRLLGRQLNSRTMGAASQQGLLQIVRDFCDHSNSLCTDCLFPEMVRGLGGP